MVPNSQFVSTAKVADDMMNRKYVIWLWTLHVLTELKIGQNKIRVCHNDKVDQTPDNTAIEQVEDFIWNDDGIVLFQAFTWG